MEIKLSPQESEQFFLSALCNGLSQLMGYDISIDYSQPLYRKCSKKLRNIANGRGPCFEDVLMEILRSGGELKFIDEQVGGDYNVSITLPMVHERVQGAPTWALLKMVNETDDADTADVILQAVAYQQVVFG